MSAQKLSSAALDTSLQRAGGLAKDANNVYQLARNLVFAVGFTATVFLPLASSDQPPDPTQQPIKVQIPPIEVGPIEPVLIPPDDWELVTHSFDVLVQTSAIQGAPPMGREWHRTTFSNAGDQFWALPDANFTMVFTPGEDFTGCSGDGCRGSFEVSSKSGGKLFDLEAIDHRMLAVDGETAGVDCKERSTPLVLTQTVVCELPTGTPSSCVEIRRSEHPPVTGEGSATELQKNVLALDIRWKQKTGESCPEN